MKIQPSSCHVLLSEEKQVTYGALKNNCKSRKGRVASLYPAWGVDRTSTSWEVVQHFLSKDLVFSCLCLCQSLTVLTGIFGATRVCLRLDFSWDGVIWNSSAISKNEMRRKKQIFFFQKNSPKQDFNFLLLLFWCHFTEALSRFPPSEWEAEMSLRNHRELELTSFLMLTGF